MNITVCPDDESYCYDSTPTLPLAGAVEISVVKGMHRLRRALQEADRHYDAPYDVLVPYSSLRSLQVVSYSNRRSSSGSSCHAAAVIPNRGSRNARSD